MLNTMHKSSNAFTRFRDFLSPAVADDIRSALEQVQLETMQQQVPMLLGVGALNIVIIMAACFNEGLPFISYGWMVGIIIYCALRGRHYHRRMVWAVTPDQPSLIPKNVTVLALLMMAGLSLLTCFTFMAGTFSVGILIPVSLAFGATAIANCLYTLRPAAIGMLMLGIMPSAAAMIVVGSFQAVMLGLSMMSVAVLMVRFVSAQYDQLVASLFLEKQIRDLANTDALTGLANRRAVMAMLDAEASDFEKTGARFGLGLLDLDGFKAVNDTHGHYIGDAFLGVVAQRLAMAVDSTDSVGRLGGDEFIIIFRDIRDNADVKRRSTALLSKLCIPAEVEGHTLPVAASIGHCVAARGQARIADMLTKADKALYAQKRKQCSEALTRSTPYMRVANWG